MQNTTELIGILQAISIVAKSLVLKLMQIEKDVAAYESGAGADGGAEWKKTKAYGGKGAGGESGEAELKYTGAEAGEESAPLPFLAGGRGKEGMETDGEATGTAWHPDGD